MHNEEESGQRVRELADLVNDARDGRRITIKLVRQSPSKGTLGARYALACAAGFDPMRKVTSC
jgi:hypothetical protein